MHILYPQEIGQLVNFVFWKVHFQNDWNEHQSDQIISIVIRTVEKLTEKFVWEERAAYVFVLLQI